MDLSTIVLVFQRNPELVPRAVSVLFNYTAPLSEREAAKLHDFTRQRQETGTEAEKVPDDIKRLMERPLQRLPGVAVVQCVLGAAKIPSFPAMHQRRLQLQLLPYVARQTPLCTEDWGRALSQALALPISHSTTALRCAEEVVKAAAPALFPSGGPPATEESAEKVKSLFFKALADVLVHYAKRHAAGKKDAISPVTSCSAARSRKGFLESGGPLKRLRKMISTHFGHAHEKWLAGAQSLSHAEALTLFLAAPWSFPVTKEILLQVVKNSPTLLVSLFGEQPAPGSLIVDCPDDVIAACMYNMGLTNCSLNAARGYLVALMALTEESKRAYYKSRGMDGFLQLLTPFVNNGKVLTSALAQEWQDMYALLFLQTGAEEEMLPLFFQAASHLVVNRCLAVNDKTSIMTLSCAVMRHVSDAARAVAPVAELTRMIERELASPAADAAAAAWRLLRLSQLETEVAEEMRSALKTTKSNEQLRRVMLMHISPERAAEDVVDGLICPLLEECAEVEVCRADAFLSLRIAAKRQPDLVPKLCGLLCDADVVAQLGRNADELDALVETVLEIAKLGIFSPIALLLTHKSGLLRRRVCSYILSTVADNADAVLALWESMTQTVFGLRADKKPNILSSNAADALVLVASALLQHINRKDVLSTLCDIILCCGHDHIQGTDPYYFQCNASLLGRRRTSSKVVQSQVLRRLFVVEEEKQLLMHHSEAIAERLCECFEGPLHLSTAASRGMVLLLCFISTNSEQSERVFWRLFDATEKAVNYLKSLDPRDSAIAASSVTALQQYEEYALKMMGLLKTYSDKPPKGMSEEDYEDLKRKDAVALEKGREEVRREVQERTRVIEETLRRKKVALATIRTLGTTGDFSLKGVAILYPYLQKTFNLNLISEVLYHNILDAIVGLLSKTVFGSMAENIACTIAQIRSRRFCTAKDVSQISAVALRLRQVITHMIPAPLVEVLFSFSWLAFEAGQGTNSVRTTIPVATQHQIMGLLMQNVGQPDLANPIEVLNLFVTIIQNFPSLFKNVQQGINMIMPMIPVTGLPALGRFLFHRSEVVKKLISVAYYRFSHFANCRRALVLAAVFLHDTSSDIVKSMRLVTENPAYAFSLDQSDWKELLYFLENYGQEHPSHAACIAKAMLKLFLFPSVTEAQQRLWIEELKKIGGKGAVVAIEVLSSFLVGYAFQDAQLFLCDMIESSNDEETTRLVLASGRAVLNACTLDILKTIAPILQKRCSKPPKCMSATNKEFYLATSCVWLTIISCRLKETALLEAIIDQQSCTLNKSSSAMVHKAVCASMVEITRNEEVRNSPKLDDFVEKSLKHIISSSSYIKKKAHAYGLAGVLHGLGLTSLRRYRIMDVMREAAKEKQAERCGVMIMFEIFSEEMGAKFEPYALAMCDSLLEGVADKDQKVSECADDASRAMMSSLTAVGLRQLIPRLVSSLSAEQSKMRIAPLNFIGYVAFCSPKQLAAALPEVTKHINSCLFDVNHNVSTAATNALRRVAGVVSNVEIKEHVEVILSALRSPSTETENALDALLYTRFLNAVDPASLALIIPILTRGLSAQMPHTRPKAAQIVASMVNLVNDTNSLKPYSEELVKLLEEATEDPRSETRTTGAKAIAALAAAVGGKLVDDIVSWCFTVLQKPCANSVEKAGAAQVFVELVESCGDSVLYDSFSQLQAGMLDSRALVREGFLHIMVYSPSSFSHDKFQRFLPLALPWVLDGLSHFSERVREVALAAGSGIIGLYGTRNLSLLLEPLQSGVVSEITTLRQSAMLLVSKLILHLVQQIRKKTHIHVGKSSNGTKTKESTCLLGQEEEGQEVKEDVVDDMAGVFEMQCARDVEKRGVSILGFLEETLGTQCFVRLLSALYCGRHEHNLNVRAEASSAWQASVASLRGAVKKIFNGLVDVLVLFSSSENVDCVEMAMKTIEFTSRLNEMIEPLIEAFCDCYKNKTCRGKLGALRCLANLVVYLDSKRLIGVGGQIVGCVLPGMQDHDERVQECAREVFGKVSKKVGSRLIEDAITAQIETSVRGVVEVVKVKPEMALKLIFDHMKSQPVNTQINLELLDAILDVEEVDDHMYKYVDCAGQTLLAFILQELDGATETYQKFIETLSFEYLCVPEEQWKKALRSPKTERGALLAAMSYGFGVSVEYVEGISAVFRAAIESLGKDDEEMRAIAVSMIPRLITSLEQRVVDSLREEEKEDVTTSKRAVGRYLLQYLDVFQQTFGSTARAVVSDTAPEFGVLACGEPTRLFDAFMSFYNRGLDYGKPGEKVQAVECIQDLLTYAPRNVSASSVNTVAGRCSKVLFTRNDSYVVLALVKLCLQLMNYPASGKEKMVESTMALAMFNVSLCDSGEARVLALHVVIQLLQRSEKYADLILGTVLTKRTAVDSPLLRGVMCRFISVVMRYSHFSKPLTHITKLMDMILPIWDMAETPAITAVAGVAVAALCMSASITDEYLAELQKKALVMLSARSSVALGGFAFVHSIILSCPARVSSGFIQAAAKSLLAAASIGAADKLTIVWILRAAAALASTGQLQACDLKAETYAPLLHRVDTSDEVMMSTAQFYCDVLAKNYPAAATAVADVTRERSTQWGIIGHFDADLDDEVAADTAY